MGCAATIKQFTNFAAAISTGRRVHYRDIPTMEDDTLAQRYEQTMARLEQITNAG
jgi:hypothetical protein